MQFLIDLANNSVYPAQGLLALYGVYHVILVFRRIWSKQFSSSSQAERFYEEIRGHLQSQRADLAEQLCDSPPYWSKAVPQLMLLAMRNGHRDAGFLRRLVSERFDRDVLADIAYRMAWVSTVVKTAPMLGLLGTVLGMISAFGKIAVTQSGGNDPKALASDISFALITTAVGLIIAIPLVVVQGSVNVKQGKLQDAVQQYLGLFFDDWDEFRKRERPGSGHRS